MKSIYLILFYYIISQAQAAYLPLQYINTTYESNIKTVLITQENSYERFPAIDLNSQQKLRLEFDDLMPENDNYQFTFIHCSSDWKPSNLKKNDYLSGNLFQNILEY